MHFITGADRIRDELKPIERRLKVLTEHIRQSDNYTKHKKIYKQYQQEKNPKRKAEFAQKHDTAITLYEAASGYLKRHLNGRNEIPLRSWKAERVKLTAERKTLDMKYYKLKEEIKEAEQIRKSVYSIVRQEERERQPRRAQNIDR